MIGKVRHFFRYLDHHAAPKPKRARSAPRPARLHVAEGDRRPRRSGTGSR